MKIDGKKGREKNEWWNRKTENRTKHKQKIQRKTKEKKPNVQNRMQLKIKNGWKLRNKKCVL